MIHVPAFLLKEKMAMQARADGTQSLDKKPDRRNGVSHGHVFKHFHLFEERCMLVAKFFGKGRRSIVHGDTPLQVFMERAFLLSSPPGPFVHAHAQLR
jgi:hypothetical protein